MFSKAKMFKKLLGAKSALKVMPSPVKREEWITDYTQERGVFEFRTLEKFGLKLMEFKSGGFVVLKSIEDEEELRINHCNFEYAEIKMINGELCGGVYFYFFKLNSQGVPISNPFEEEYFDFAEQVAVGESEYFEWFEEKTLKKEVANLNSDSTWSYGKVYCIQNRETEELTEIMVNERGSTMTIVDQDHKPIIDNKTKDIVKFHDIYVKDGVWYGSSGTEETEISSNGMPI